MFTGIIEVLGRVEKIEKEGTNVHYTISCPLTSELKIDQSVAHNGVCLTVVEISGDQYVVTAIEETLNRTSIGNLKVGDVVNIERAMSASARLDGHFVQGHVDTTAKCIAVETVEGSWYFSFQYDLKPEWLLVDKGSICINGTSLTVIDPKNDGTFSVAIIPYTYENTIFHKIEVGTEVNLEFDMIGKYITRYMQLYQK